MEKNHKNYTIIEENKSKDFILIQVKSGLYKNENFPILNITPSVLDNTKDIYDQINEIAVNTINSIIKEKDDKSDKESFVDFTMKDFTNFISNKIVDSKDIDIDLNFIN